MAYDIHSLLAQSTIQSGSGVIGSTSGTTVAVTATQGALFSINQNALIWPNGAIPTKANSEVVRITAISTDTLTVTRAQEGTAALNSIAAGYQIANTITPKVLTDVEGMSYGLTARSLTQVAPVWNDGLDSGWTTNFYASGTITSDTTNQLFGSACIKITPLTDGSFTGPVKTWTPIDASDLTFSVWVKCDNWSGLSQLLVLMTNDNTYTNFFDFNVTSKLVTPANNEWYEITWTTADCFNDGGTSTSFNGFSSMIFRAKASATCNVWFDNFCAYPSAQRGKVSIVFDDGWASAYTQAKPLMDNYGYAGTSAVIHEFVGTTNYMTQTQVDTLHDTGWDIVGHGNTNLTSLSGDALETELRGAASYLKSHGYRGQDIYVYPGGGNNQTVRQTLQHYFKAARTIDAPMQPLLHVNPLRINAPMVINTTTLATVEGLVDAALAGGHWLILVFHELVSASPTTYQWLISNFSSLIDYLHSKNAEVVTLSNVLTTHHPRRHGLIHLPPNGSSVAINADATDVYIIPAQTANFTVTNPTGTPSDGQKLVIRITSGTTGYAPTWGTAYKSSGTATLPTTALPASKTVTLSFMYDAVAAAWVLQSYDGTGY